MAYGRPYSVLHGGDTPRGADKRYLSRYPSPHGLKCKDSTQSSVFTDGGNGRGLEGARYYPNTVPWGTDKALRSSDLSRSGPSALCSIYVTRGYWSVSGQSRQLRVRRRNPQAAWFLLASFLYTVF